MIPNVTKVWVGEVRQRLNFALKYNPQGNYRTQRTKHDNEQLAITAAKMAYSAREPSLTTQSTNTNGREGNSRNFQQQADYRKGEFDIEHDDCLEVQFATH